MHPALPTEPERADADFCRYGDLLPRFSGTPESLVVNRVAPAAFAAV